MLLKSVWGLLLVGVGLIASCPSAPASTIVERELTCPFDGATFKAVLQGSGTSFGAMLDLRPFGPIISPWPIASCPTNGFVFFKDNFTDEELEQLKPLVLSDEFQSLRSETPYYRAAWLKARSGTPRSNVSWTLLQATWEARDADTYRRYADELLNRLPDDIEEDKDPDKGAQLRLLVVELLRRTGRLEAAEVSVSEALSVIEEGTAPYLIAQYQRQLIEQRDSSPRRVPETVGKRAKPSKHWMAQRLPITDANPTVFGDLMVQFPARYFLWSMDSGAIATTWRSTVATFGVDGRPSLQVAVPDDFGLLRAALPSGGWLATPTTRTGMYSSKQRIAQLDEFMNTAVELEVDKPIYSVNSIAVTNDGKSAIVNLGMTVAYELAENRLSLFPWPEGSFDIVASDRTRPRLLLFTHVSPTRGNVMLWDYAENKAIWTAPIDGGTRRPFVSGASLSPDGTRAYVAAEFQGDCETIAIDASNGSVLARWQGKGNRPRVSVGASGRLIATACGQTLAILDRDLAELERISARDTFKFGDVAFSPDGTRIAIEMGDAVSVFAVRR